MPSILCHCGTRYTQSGSYRCQDCRCKIPQKLYQPCFVLLIHFSTDFQWLIFKFIITEFLGTDYHCFLFLSTDYHRLTQIFKYQRYFNYHRLLSLIFPFFNLSIFQSNQSLWLLICANLWNLWSIKNIAQPFLIPTRSSRRHLRLRRSQSHQRLSRQSLSLNHCQSRPSRCHPQAEQSHQ